MQFDLNVACGDSTIPSGATISSAQLRIYRSDAVNNRSYGVQRVEDSWNEATVTWASRPDVVATATEVLASPPNAAGYVTWNVTADVQEFIDGAATNNGWRLRDTGSGNTTSTFVPSEGAADQLPELVVEWSV